MTRKQYERQYESFVEAQQKLKRLVSEIHAIEEKNKPSTKYKDKIDALSVAFEHYNNQASAFRRYVYDSKRISELDKSRERLEKAKRRIDSWYLYNKKYPEDLDCEGLFPEDVFAPAQDLTNVDVPAPEEMTEETNNRGGETAGLQEQDKRDDTPVVEEVVPAQPTGALVDNSVPTPLNHLDADQGGTSDLSHPPHDENADDGNSRNTSDDISVHSSSHADTMVPEKPKTAKGVVPTISVVQVTDLAQDGGKGADSVLKLDDGEVSQSRTGSHGSEESGSSMTRLRFQIQVQREVIHEEEQLEDEEF